MNTTDSTSTASSLAWTDRFIHRHIGPNADETNAMLKACGYSSLDELIATAVPRQIRLNRALRVPPARSEPRAVSRDKNEVAV